MGGGEEEQVIAEGCCPVTRTPLGFGTRQRESVPARFRHCLTQALRHLPSCEGIKHFASQFGRRKAGEEWKGQAELVNIRRLCGSPGATNENL